MEQSGQGATPHVQDTRSAASREARKRVGPRRRAHPPAPRRAVGEQLLGPAKALGSRLGQPVGAADFTTVSRERVRHGDQFTLFPVSTLLPDPRDELCAFQQWRCDACGQPLTTSSHPSKESSGRRITGWVCHGCALARRARTVPAVERATPLLRLRLTRGPRPTGSTKVLMRHRQALASEDWNQFPSLQHALWTRQGGRCALWSYNPPAEEMACTNTLVIDYDRDTGLIRGLLCRTCNSTEGKGGTDHPLAQTWHDYKTDLDVQAFLPVRGVTYEYLKA